MCGSFEAMSGQYIVLGRTRAPRLSPLERLAKKWRKFYCGERGACRPFGVRARPTLVPGKRGGSIIGPGLVGIDLVHVLDGRTADQHARLGGPFCVVALVEAANDDVAPRVEVTVFLLPLQHGPSRPQSEPVSSTAAWTTIWPSIMVLSWCCGQAGSRRRPSSWRGPGDWASRRKTASARPPDYFFWSCRAAPTRSRLPVDR